MVLEKTFLGKSGQKNKNRQFKQNFDIKTNLNMRNSMMMLLFQFLTGNTFFSQIWSKKPKSRFKIKIGTYTNLNVKNSIVVSIFFCYRPEVYFFFGNLFQKSNYLVRLKLRISEYEYVDFAVNFPFFVRKYPFCVNLIQRFKRVSLRRNLKPRLIWICKKL